MRTALLWLLVATTSWTPSSCAWVLWQWDLTYNPSETQKPRTDTWVIYRAYDSLADCEKNATAAYLAGKSILESGRQKGTATNLSFDQPRNQYSYRTPAQQSTPILEHLQRFVCVPSDLDPRERK
jgi:hypothetical protein